MPTVRVKVLDATPAHNPVGGVACKIYDADGVTLITQGTTDAVTGVAEFVLDEGVNYYLRAGKSGASIVNPHILAVDDEDIQTHAITADVASSSVAPDVAKCRVTGHMVNAAGDPIENAEVKFIATQDLRPTGSGIVAAAKIIKSDEDGRIQLDLFRGMYYDVYVMDDPEPNTCLVPNAGSISLEDLIYPVPSAVTFTPDTVTMNRGEEQEVSVSITLTDHRSLRDIHAAGALDTYVDLQTQTGLVIEEIGTDSIVLRAETEGVYTVTASNKSGSSLWIHRVPITSISGELGVVVQP